MRRLPIDTGGFVRRLVRPVVVAVAFVAVVAACGSQASPPDAAKKSPEVQSVKSRVWTDEKKPPPFTLHYGNKKLDIKPYGYCYGTTCADGIPRKPLASVGSPQSVVIELGLKDWTIEANFRASGEPCGQSQSTTLKPDKDGLYHLTPLGHAGAYDVQLFGRGEGGDVAGSFRWKTPADGPLTAPSAIMALIADQGGKPESYGLELGLTNLAVSPKTASAKIKVTAANGRSLEFTPPVAGHSCAAGGNVSFALPAVKAKAAAAIGGFPFVYDVTVSLDGTKYRATATYPSDQIEGNEPNVALRFSPALPASQ